MFYNLKNCSDVTIKRFLKLLLINFGKKRNVELTLYAFTKINRFRHFNLKIIITKPLLNKCIRYLKILELI